MSRVFTYKIGNRIRYGLSNIPGIVLATNKTEGQKAYIIGTFTEVVNKGFCYTTYRRFLDEIANDFKITSDITVVPKHKLSNHENLLYKVIYVSDIELLPAYKDTILVNLENNYYL